jgi:hypothetical protein
MTSTDVTVIVVTYGGWDRVRTCLQSVFRECAGLSAEVIVVDNASFDGTADRVRREFPLARLVANENNRGFAAANNQGIRASRGRYVLLLNPDTEVHRGAIGAVMEFLEIHPSAWVAGCRLLSADGSLQPSVGPFPSVLEGVLKSSFLYLLLPENAVISSRRIRRIEYASPARVDWVMGAFFMVRREAFDGIGLLDEQFFMYSEEVDFCRRVWDAGHEVWYSPAGTVTHYWGGQNSVSSRTFLWLLASQFLYLRKHYRGLERVSMILLKYIGLAFRAVVYACIGCLTLNRKLLAKSSYTVTAIWRLLVTPIPALWETR